MKPNIQHRWSRHCWGCGVAMLVLLGSLIGGSPAEAILTPQGINGTVEIKRAGGLDWLPLTSAIRLQAGDQVRTMPGSVVELWFDDGSLFSLGETTQIAFEELQVIPEQKTRIARITLAFGTITAKITKLGFTQSLCEIKTGTAIVGIKFSQVTVQRSQDGSEPDAVIADQGLVDIQQIAEGGINVSARIDSEEGMNFMLNSVGALVSLNVQNLLRRITLISDVTMSNFLTLMGNFDNFLKIENLGDTPILCKAGEHSVMIQSQAQATVGISPDRDLQVDAAKAAFTYQQRELQGDVVMVFNHLGLVSLDGEAVAPGSFKSVAFGMAGAEAEEGESRTLEAPEKPEAAEPRILSEDQENRVAPPSKEPETPKGGGLETIPTVAPTPTEIPTETPTETTTEIPTETPIEATPTPTKTPTPYPIVVKTATPTPLPTNTPMPTNTPVPTPTQAATAVPTNTPEPTAQPTSKPTAKPTLPPKPTKTPASPIYP